MAINLEKMLLTYIVLLAFCLILDAAYPLKLSHYTKRYTFDDEPDQRPFPVAQCTQKTSPCRCSEVYPREIVIECSKANLDEVEQAIESVAEAKMQLLAVDIYGLNLIESRSRVNDNFFSKYGSQPRALVIQDCKIKKSADGGPECRLELAPDAFRSLEDTMVTLKIDCPTSSDSLEAVKKLRALNVLQLDRLKISHLSALPFDNLIQLYLRHDEIGSIDQAAFERSGQLEVLNLDFNQLQSFDTTCLDPMDNLKEVSLSRNGLRRIDGAFDVTPALENLDLSHNNLSRLPKSLFAELARLKILKLESNRLTDINADDFGALTNLEILSLHDNELRKIGDFSLQTLNNLKSIFLSKNCASNQRQNDDDLEPEAMIIEDQAFAGLSNLKMLDFDCNVLQSLRPNIFLNTPALKYLVLANVDIRENSKLNNETFGNLGALTHLYMAGFDLDQLRDETIFRPLVSLQELNLVSHVPELLQCQKALPAWFENFVKNSANNFSITLPNCLPKHYYKYG